MDETSFPNAKPRRALLIAYRAFSDLAGKGSLFVITIVAARRLSPESFGVFSLGSALGWIVAVVSDGGIQLHLARAVARRPEQARQLLREWLWVRLWTAAFAIAGVTLAVATRWRGPSAAPIAILALVYACSGLIELLHYFYRGLSRSEVESSLTLWQRGGTLACGLIALAWHPDVTRLAIAMLIPVVATLAWSVRIASRMTDESRLRDDSRDADRPPPADQPPRTPGTFTTFRRDIWPIGAGIVLSALYFRIDVFLVQLWSGTESVALYNAVFRLVEALRLFPAAVLAVMLPALVRAGNLRPLARVAVPLTAFAVAATGLLWLSAGWMIPWLYGARYAPAVPAFRVLLLSFPLLSLNLALTHQLVGWDGQRAYAGLCLLALAINVALNARLIPIWSIEGAAWATLGTEMVLTTGCAVALLTARAPSLTRPLPLATEA
ncbi:MAG TPA: flippase [Vicinamibacterales bacterium]|nr:flippase [Vicinamibacterales bacterium]